MKTQDPRPAPASSSLFIKRAIRIPAIFLPNLQLAEPQDLKQRTGIGGREEELEAGSGVRPIRIRPIRIRHPTSHVELGS